MSEKKMEKMDKRFQKKFDKLFDSLLNLFEFERTFVYQKSCKTCEVYDEKDKIEERKGHCSKQVAILRVFGYIVNELQDFVKDNPPMVESFMESLTQMEGEIDRILDKLEKPNKQISYIS